MTLVEPEVCPSECAVAVGIPSAVDEFSLARAHRGRRRFAAGLFGSLDERSACERYAASVIAPLEEARMAVERIGVAWRQGATLADVAELSMRYAVVIVVGHSVQMPLSVPELINPAGFVTAIRARGDALTSWLDEELQKAWPDLRPDQVVESAASQRFCDVMNDAMRRNSLRALGPLGGTVAPPRSVLEHLLREHIRPAPAIELMDDMHTVETFARASSTRDGAVLDLTMCCAGFVAEVIKVHRPNLTIVACRDDRRLVEGLVGVVAALEELNARGSARYTDCVVATRRALQRSLWT